MKEHIENQLMSSLLLYVDHTVCKVGEAFSNHGSYFYPADTMFSSHFKCYSAPFKQLVMDESITNAQVMSGVYVGSTFTKPGEGSLNSINHTEGQVHFDYGYSSSSTISGNYSVKDFNIYLTSKAETELLFETKFERKPKVSQVNTGLAPNKQTYPCIFLRNNGGLNEPFAFGGMDMTKLNVRAVVLADSAFSRDAVCGILKDSARDYLPIIEKNLLPFNAIGSYTGSAFNYETISATPMSQSNAAFIKDVTVTTNIPQYINDNINPNVHSAMIDFYLEIPRMTNN